MRKRVTGLPSGAVDLERQEVRFDLTVEGRTMEFVAKAGVVDQIIAGLARAATTLREDAIKRGLPRPTAAETVAGAMISRERVHDLVMMQLVTDRQVPYTFVMSRHAAIDISARLKTEAERDVTLGSA